MNIQHILADLGIQDQNPGVMIGAEALAQGKALTASPVDGSRIASLSTATADDYERVMAAASGPSWNGANGPPLNVAKWFANTAMPSCQKRQPWRFVSYEMGKSYQEGLGEVQEMIDICDFAVGQSRQLYGLTMHSERPNHRCTNDHPRRGGHHQRIQLPCCCVVLEHHLAWIAGDACVWKPSEKAPLCSIAPTHLERRPKPTTFQPAPVASSTETTRWEMMTRPPRSARVCHRLHPDGQDCGPGRGGTPDVPCLNWAATTPSSSLQKLT